MQYSNFRSKNQVYSENKALSIAQQSEHSCLLSPYLFAESIPLLRDSSQSVAVRGGRVLGQGQGVLQAVVFLPQSFDFLLQGTEGAAVVISGPSAAAGVSTASRTLAHIQIGDAFSCLWIGCSLTSKLHMYLLTL